MIISPGPESIIKKPIPNENSFAKNTANMRCQDLGRVKNEGFSAFFLFLVDHCYLVSLLSFPCGLLSRDPFLAVALVIVCVFSP